MQYSDESRIISQALPLY